MTVVLFIIGLLQLSVMCYIGWTLRQMDRGGRH